MFADLPNIFTKTNCNFSQVVAYMIRRFLARFSEKFFTFCRGVAFHLNSIATQLLSKYISYSENSRSPFELCASEIPARWPLSLFHHFSHITSGITLPRFLLEEYRFHRLSFRCPSSFTYLLILLPSLFPIYFMSRDIKFFTTEFSVFLNRIKIWSTCPYNL